MSDAFKFNLAAVKPKPAPQPKPPSQAAAVDAVAERHQFTSREPAKRVKRERSRPHAGPIEVLSVKGPLEVINRFKDYCNADGHSSYWQAIDELLKRAGR